MESIYWVIMVSLIQRGDRQEESVVLSVVCAVADIMLCNLGTLSV